MKSQNESSKPLPKCCGWVCLKLLGTVAM